MMCLLVGWFDFGSTSLPWVMQLVDNEVGWWGCVQDGRGNGDGSNEIGWIMVGGKGFPNGFQE